MQTEQENPNVWVVENSKPHYLHDGFWYGPNVVQSDDGPTPSFYQTTNGKIIETENGQYLYEYNSVWYGQDKIFKLNKGEWEQKKRGDDYYTISYEDGGTISTLIDIQLMYILAKYNDTIKKLSKSYRTFISDIWIFQSAYGDISMLELRIRNLNIYNYVYNTLLPLARIDNKNKLSEIIAIVFEKLKQDPVIRDFKIDYKSREQPILQNMLYYRIIYFYLRYNTQEDIDEQIEQYIEIFDRYESRDLIREEYEKIKPYLENAVSNSNPLNVLQIDESELLGKGQEFRTGSDTFISFKDDFIVSCLYNAKCYIYISSNTEKFSEKLTNENSTAMLYTEDILIKALLSFRTWLFKCTGERLKNESGTYDLSILDYDGNKMIDPIAYALLPFMGDSSCLVSLSNILSILRGKNRIFYIVMKKPIDYSVSWDVLYNYNVESTMFSGKHCQAGSNQQVCELYLSSGQVTKDAFTIRKQYDDAAEPIKNRILSRQDDYLNHMRRFYLADRAYREKRKEEKREEKNKEENEHIELLKTKEQDRIKRERREERKLQKILQEAQEIYRTEQLNRADAVQIQPYNSIELISTGPTRNSGRRIPRGKPYM